MALRYQTALSGYKENIITDNLKALYTLTGLSMSTSNDPFKKRWYALRRRCNDKNSKAIIAGELHDRVKDFHALP